MTDGKRVGFTIRHSVNWRDQITEVRAVLSAARKDSAKWLDFAEQLARWKVSTDQRETYLKRFMPISDDMSLRVVNNTTEARESIRQILASPTCEHIAETGYGLLMASTEWSDHVRPHRSPDTYVSRQLLRKEPSKARATKILRSMSPAETALV
jgi:hypothetical protein